MALATPLRALVLSIACLVSPTLLAQQSDVAADPAITFGSLKNGMRYQLQHNATPAGQIALRLRIEAGSLYENDDERGVAHLLEHMAFRGSKQFADGEASKQLQRLGLKNGADANALTTLATTVYLFDLPTNDAKSLDTALTLLREIASELTLSPAALDSERNIVESEARVRAAPFARLGEAAQSFNFEGRRLGDRSPIGKPEILAHATPDLLRHFYQTWYRPERAVLIAVGDFDVKALQGEIDKHFGSWKGVGQAGTEPDLGTAAGRAFSTRVHQEEGAPPAIAVNWILPARQGPETKAWDRESFFRDVGLLTLTRRLQLLVKSPNPPYQGAAANRVIMSGSGEFVVSVGAQYFGDDWRKALAALESMRRVTLERGIPQAELDETVHLITQTAQQLADRAPTRASSEIAASQLHALDTDGIPESPEQSLEDVRSYSAGMTAEDVKAALEKAFSGPGPLVLLSTSSPATDDAMLAQAFRSAQSMPLLAPNVTEKPPWPYSSFGPPGMVADRQYVNDMDVTLVRFANGVRLNIKPTKFQANEVSVFVGVGDGRLELPKNRPSAIWVAIAGGYLAGGVAGIDLQQMQQALDGKLYKLGFALGDASFMLRGDTRPADLDTQLQVLAAYVKSPAFRPQAFTLARQAMLSRIRQLDSGAALGVFVSQIGGLLHAGDPRWRFPVAADVEATQPDDLRALIGNTLSFGPMEITIVGDVEVDAAIEAVAATFGALPRRSSQTLKPGAADIRFPRGGKEPVVVSHHGRDDQGMAAIAWPTTDQFSRPKDVPALGLMCDIIQLRLAEQLRIAAGVSYSAECASRPSAQLPGYGFALASADIQPTHTQLFFDTINGIVTDLRAHAPSSDEMERVQKAAVLKYKQLIQSNPFWLDLLVSIQRDPKHLDIARDALYDLESVKPADVQRVAAKYLLDKTAYRMVVGKNGAVAPAP